MGPRQRAFGEVRVGGRQAPLVDLGEVGADPGPHGRIVAVLRHVDEERDEAPEAVGPRQHADARPVGEVDDGQREAVQPLDVDLEQVVARIGLQHVQQRAPGMARRVEAGARCDLGDLAAQIGHLAGRGAVGGGGEQAENAHLAREGAALREQLDRDVVEMDRAVDARAHARLSDDQRLRRVEEGSDLGRHAAQDPAQALPGALGVAQEPQGRVAEIGWRSSLDSVRLHSKQGEMPVAQPFEQGQSLGDLGLGQGQRSAPVALGEGVHQRQHGGKVVGGRHHVPIDLGEALGEPRARLGIVEAVEVDVDHALAVDVAMGLGGGLAADPREAARLVAFHREDRMGDEERRQAQARQFGQSRIEEERAVVVDDVENGQLALAAVALHRDVGERDGGRPVRAPGRRKMSPRGDGQGREGLGRVGREVFRGHAPEEVADEAARLPALGGERRARVDQAGPRRPILARGQSRRRIHRHLDLHEPRAESSGPSRVPRPRRFSRRRHGISGQGPRRRRLNSPRGANSEPSG